MPRYEIHSIGVIQINGVHPNFLPMTPSSVPPELCELFQIAADLGRMARGSDYQGAGSLFVRGMLQVDRAWQPCLPNKNAPWAAFPPPPVTAPLALAMHDPQLQNFAGEWLTVLFDETVEPEDLADLPELLPAPVSANAAFRQAREAELAREVRRAAFASLRSAKLINDELRSAAQNPFVLQTTFIVINEEVSSDGPKLSGDVCMHDLKDAYAMPPDAIDRVRKALEKRRHEKPNVRCDRIPALSNAEHTVRWRYPAAWATEIVDAGRKKHCW